MSKKMDKYTGLAADYHCQPIAVEMLGLTNESASHFLTVLVKRIGQCSGDERETAFLFQRISAAVEIQQHSASRLVYSRGLPGVMATPTICYSNFFLESLAILDSEGIKIVII